MNNNKKESCKDCKKKVEKIFGKKLLTRSKASDILSESLEGDEKVQLITANVVRKKMVFEN